MDLTTPQITIKHLKSSLSELRELFERSINVKHVAEPLISFDANYSASQVRKFMEEKDYDDIGVRQNGLVSGYARKSDITNGQLGDYLIAFEPRDLLLETTPLVNVLERLKDIPRAFVIFLGQVGGIVTRGDLQKAPIRMWLFGLVSLIEMQLLRLIREYHSAESWKLLISPKRLTQAEVLLADRRKRNEAIDLADCIQFADKRDIVVKTEGLCKLLGFTSKNIAKGLLKELEDLRNQLAHSQDILTGSWPDIANLIAKSEHLLHTCENAMVVSRATA